MAVYHCKINVINRASGKSSTASAAYRLAARIDDDRTGRTHDYTRKAGVLASGTVGWDSNDHASLWNAAEAADKRSNSRTAREVLVALPSEMNEDQKARLVRGFTAHLRDRYGVAASWALHAPPRGGDERNQHAHILMTTRKVEAGMFGEKTRLLDDRESGPKEVLAIRQEWEKRVNRELERMGSDARVSSRKRMIEPMEHLGPIKTAQERRGVKTRAGNRNRQREKERASVRPLVGEIRALQQEQRIEDRALAEAAAKAEAVKAAALEEEAKRQRQRAKEAAAMAAAAARESALPTQGFIIPPSKQVPAARERGDAIPLDRAGRAIWDGVLSAEPTEAKALRLARQVGTLEDRHGRQAVKAEITRSAPVGARRDAWAVMQRVAEEGRRVAAATFRAMLAEIARLAESKERARQGEKRQR